MSGGWSTHYFLSRPRRFGKSLFVDTLKELFEGNEALFRGLAVHDHWDWSARHPVLRLSFGGGLFREPGGLHTSVMAQLDDVEREAGAVSDCPTASERLRDVLAALHRRAGRRVVVLVDEYDKPILDALDVPDVARANRDFLRGLYAMIKDCDAHVRFARRACTTPSTSCCSFAAASSTRTGSRPARRPSWSRRCSSAG